MSALGGKRTLDRYVVVESREAKMFKAMVEIVGAFVAAAPVSDDAAGRKNRLYALLLLVAVTVLVGALVLHQ